MIIKPSLTELLEVTKNRFELVIITSKRARQIVERDRIEAEKAEEFDTKININKKSPVAIAAEEILEGMVVKC